MTHDASRDMVRAGLTMLAFATGEDRYAQAAHVAFDAACAKLGEAPFVPRTTSVNADEWSWPCDVCGATSRCQWQPRKGLPSPLITYGCAHAGAAELSAKDIAPHVTVPAPERDSFDAANQQEADSIMASIMRRS